MALVLCSKKVTLMLLDPYRLLARWIKKDPEAWIALGDLETRLLERYFSPLHSPIYISGMARAGTTILTEALATHPEVATHIYRDFPCLFTPYLWNRLLGTFDWVPFKKKPQERAHKDGIMVTNLSPEAMEEMLWMAFFRKLHDESHSVVLGTYTGNQPRDQKFSDFYKAHIQKLLLVRKKSRYVTKANYNLTRVSYILNILPDARFVMVVRHPLTHVWSSFCKDALFRKSQEQSSSSLIHMDQVGHFEFGYHRTLINTGEPLAMTFIQECFQKGDDVRAWAHYWAMLHRFIYSLAQIHPEIKIVRHEDFVLEPEKNLREIYDHCRLTYDAAILHKAVLKIKSKAHPIIPDLQRAIIVEETNKVATDWGYDVNTYP